LYYRDYDLKRDIFSKRQLVTGVEVWNWSYSIIDEDSRNTPVIGEKYILLSTQTRNKHPKEGRLYEYNFYCLDVEKGSLLWKFQKRIDAKAEFIIDSNIQNPTIMNSKVYLTLPDANLYCLDLNNGTIIWSFKTGFVQFQKIPMTIPMNFNFVVDDKKIYVGSISGLYSLDQATGETNWVYKHKSLTRITYETEPYKILTLYGNYILLEFEYSILTELVVIEKPTGLLVWLYPSITSRDSRFFNGYIYEGYFILSKSADSISFTINKREYSTNLGNGLMDTSTAIINNTAYISPKYLMDNLGGTIDWNQSERKTVLRMTSPASKPGDIKFVTIEFKPNNSIANVNGKNVQIDPNNPKITPIILNGRTMVPVRFLAESLGCEVKWIADSKEILITYKP